MGQTIVTSHSPYVIERFGPDQIVVLTRDDNGTLSSCTLDLGDDVKPRKYREQRRQFAEAVLANAVLVVEGGTEVVTYLAIADALDNDPSITYQHPDLAGLTVFDAGGDSRVPLYGPVFAALGKIVFGTHDTHTPLTEEQKKKAESFAIHLDIGYPRHRRPPRRRDQPRRSPQVPRRGRHPRRLPPAPRLPPRGRTRRTRRSRWRGTS